MAIFATEVFQGRLDTGISTHHTMDSPFKYDKYVTGKNFIGRKTDCNVLLNFLQQKENIVMYTPPKGGKMSLIQQTLFQLKMFKHDFYIGHFNLLNVRRTEDFILRLVATVMGTQASTPSEMSAFIAKYLPDTHFVFDQERFSSYGESVSLNWSLEKGDIEKALLLPYGVARAQGADFILVIDEFQNLGLCEDPEMVYKSMEAAFAKMKGEPGAGCSYILCGSSYNAMKEIFERRGFFHRKVERVFLHPVDSKEIVEHISKGFLMGGKVVDKDLLYGMCTLFRNNLYYINFLSYLTDSLTKGYVNESVMLDALDILISIHTPQFIGTMNSLTTFQVNLLRAVLEGATKLSSAAVIQKYSLNSSANVKRVREALEKKEVLAFNDKDDPWIIDPLFEYWAKKYYFEIPV